MKIVLHAFGNKLSGVMEVPEETGSRFSLAMMQPISCFKNYGLEITLNKPIDKICTFEWTGATYIQKGHKYDGAREYQLTDIS